MFYLKCNLKLFRFVATLIATRRREDHVSYTLYGGLVYLRWSPNIVRKSLYMKCRLHSALCCHWFGNGKKKSSNILKTFITIFLCFTDTRVSFVQKHVNLVSFSCTFTPLSDIRELSLSNSQTQNPVSRRLSLDLK